MLLDIPPTMQKFLHWWCFFFRKFQWMEKTPSIWLFSFTIKTFCLFFPVQSSAVTQVFYMYYWHNCILISQRGITIHWSVSLSSGKYNSTIIMQKHSCLPDRQPEKKSRVEFTIRVQHQFLTIVPYGWWSCKCSLHFYFQRCYHFFFYLGNLHLIGL